MTLCVGAAAITFEVGALTMARFSPTDLEHPIVLAPLAGGPATLELAAAVSAAGGLGFLAAGYKTPDAVRADLDAVRALTARPFGVNVFAPPGPPGDPDAIARFAEALRAEGREPGEPRHHDDAFAEKVELLAAEPPAVVSFTFGCPPADLVARLQDAGAAVWITVTTPGEAAAARDAGADALVAQGVEAGGHRGGFDDAAPGELGLLALLQLLDGIGVPLVAAGGIATGRGVAAVLAAGAAAAALGSAFMLTPEAGTSAPHREALAGDAPTALTRAFTGRLARGIVNAFLGDHRHAPRGYPEIHHVTAPLRAAAREAGDAETINLWAGQAYPLATTEPAGDLVRRLSAEARAAFRLSDAGP